MRIFFLMVIPILILMTACEEDIVEIPEPPADPSDLTSIAYEPVPFNIIAPDYFPDPADFIPADNPTTEAGVTLGKHLFYDPILSVDSTMSCSSCHLSNGAFTDNLAFSFGVRGEQTPRSSMALVNMVYVTDAIFWDGRASSLEEQALLPIEDPIELHESWDNVEEKLQAHPDYPAMFRQAFGIENKQEITRGLAVKAIAQFERTLVSGNSKWDKWRRGEYQFTDEELDGFLMFFDEANGALPDAECAHCHNAPLFTSNDFFNNGLDAAASFGDFEDKGLGAVTGRASDNGKFRSPTLRNIELTAPYMHDGRFQTLEEVIDHYNSGGKPADNKDPLLHNLQLDEEQKQSLIAFLKTLTDEDFINNPDYQNPFE